MQAGQHEYVRANLARRLFLELSKSRNYRHSTRWGRASPPSFSSSSFSKEARFPSFRRSCQSRDLLLRSLKDRDFPKKLPVQLALDDLKIRYLTSIRWRRELERRKPWTIICDARWRTARRWRKEEPRADPPAAGIRNLRRRRCRRRSIRHFPQRGRSAVGNIWLFWPDTLVQEYPKYEQHRITREGGGSGIFQMCAREAHRAHHRSVKFNFSRQLSGVFSSAGALLPRFPLASRMSSATLRAWSIIKFYAIRTTYTTYNCEHRRATTARC